MGRLILILPALVFLTSGCGQLLFRQDHRITVLAPASFSTVGQPVVISWESRQFTPGANGTYVVFVDRAPMPAGDTIEFFDRHDREGIFPTTNSSIKLDVMVPLESNSTAERDHHEVTIVLLDRAGHRIGEEAGFVEFNVRRGS